MNNCIDEHKSLRDLVTIQSRRNRLFDPHISSLTAFVDEIRKETGHNENIPYFDPLDGGINAKCLFLFEAPGPGAVKSGFISRNNPDESAKNFFIMNAQAGLPRKLTISWNVVPWYIGSGTKIRAANSKDIDDGKEYLRRLLLLLPHLRLIVLGGQKAQKAETWIKECCHSLPILKTWHPSPQCVNKHSDKEKEILQLLKTIKDQLLDTEI